jgi:hypothetical protein
MAGNPMFNPAMAGYAMGMGGMPAYMEQHQQQAQHQQHQRSGSGPGGEQHHHHHHHHQRAPERPNLPAAEDLDAAAVAAVTAPGASNKDRR